MAKLDRERGYGEIFGSDKRARYEQDGVQFDALGNPLDAPQEEVVKAKRNPRKPVETPALVVPPTVTLSTDDQVLSQLGLE